MGNLFLLLQCESFAALAAKLPPASGSELRMKKRGGGEGAQGHNGKQNRSVYIRAILDVHGEQ
jgi:hypothetical protein